MTPNHSKASMVEQIQKKCTLRSVVAKLAQAQNVRGVLEDGRVRRDPDASADEHDMLVFEDVFGT